MGIPTPRMTPMKLLKSVAGTALELACLGIFAGSVAFISLAMGA